MDTVVFSAIGCAGAHVALSLVFRCVHGPWSRAPAYSAHQIVAALTMAYVTIAGTVGFFSTEAQSLTTPRMRVAVVDPSGMHLVETSVGILMWSTSAMLMITQLQNAALAVHHVLFFLVACIGLRYKVMTVWANVFFGIIEGSSVPLTLYELARSDGWAERVPGREVLKYVFVVAYFVFRLGIFPYYLVVASQSVLGDALNVMQAPDPPVPPAALGGIVLFGTGLLGLQLFWGGLIVSKIVAMARPNDEKSKEP